MNFNMLKKILSGFIFLLFLVSLFAFWTFESSDQSPKCPEDFPDTNAGSESLITATDKWTNDYYDKNPAADLGDWTKARYNYWVENDCHEAIARYEATKANDSHIRKAPFLDAPSFDSYKNLNMHLAPTVTDMAIHYSPLYNIDEIVNLDVTNDGKPEKIVLYSCVGCNSPSRNMDIIKDNVLIFSAEGGQLKIEGIEKQAGFLLNTTMIPRNGYTRITFKQNSAGEFTTTQEEDIYNKVPD